MSLYPNFVAYPKTMAVPVSAYSFAFLRQLYLRLQAGKISLAGYQKHKIYGTLTCRSGKRMKKENRVFFENEAQAIAAGYRPCGHCLPAQYRAWKTIQNMKHQQP